ncbi:YraN family protein [Patescibacteria group bacterium]|nr:YraN family protein [Patescibacteria group bacterium]
MRTYQQKIGVIGEELAVKYLKKKKYKIIEQNKIVGKHGELDIIAKQNNQFVFVEVKTKTSADFGLPEEELTYLKKKKLREAIYYYLSGTSHSSSYWRLDLIAIDIRGKEIDIRHYEDIS